MPLQLGTGEDNEDSYERDPRDDVATTYLMFPREADWLHTGPVADPSQYEAIFIARVGGWSAFVVSGLIETLLEVLADSATHYAALRLQLRAEGMGLSPRAGDYSELHMSLPTTLTSLRQANIGTAVTARLDSAPPDPTFWRLRLDELLQSMEDSPDPEREWAVLRGIVGDEELAELLGVPPTEITTYAEHAATPDDLAARLHFLALLVADLTTAYNAYGVRRWFNRPRRTLGGRTPKEVLAAGWDPDGPGPREVRQLAQSLLGAQAT